MMIVIPHKAIEEAREMSMETGFSVTIVGDRNSPEGWALRWADLHPTDRPYLIVDSQQIMFHKITGDE